MNISSNTMEVLHEKSNENVYDMINPKPSSVRDKDLNVSLFSRVFSLFRNNTSSNIYSSTDSIASESNDTRIAHITPKHKPLTQDEEIQSISMEEIRKHSMESIPEKYKNQTVFERMRYYNTLCEMANVLRHIYYYFQYDIPIFVYKSFKIIGTGHITFKKGFRKHIYDLETYRAFRIEYENGNENKEKDEYNYECKNNIHDIKDINKGIHIFSDHSCETAKEGIFTIYKYLIQYDMTRTKMNYPILIYNHFVWYESYIYMRNIPLDYILHSNLSNGPVGCKICKEYAHPTLKIFQNYCEYCFKEIKSRIDQEQEKDQDQENNKKD